MKKSGRLFSAPRSALAEWAEAIFAQNSVFALRRNGGIDSIWRTACPKPPVLPHTRLPATVATVIAFRSKNATRGNESDFGALSFP